MCMRNAPCLCLPHAEMHCACTAQDTCKPICSVYSTWPELHVSCSQHPNTRSAERHISNTSKTAQVDDGNKKRR